MKKEIEKFLEEIEYDLAKKKERVYEEEKEITKKWYDLKVYKLGFDKGIICFEETVIRRLQKIINKKGKI